MWGKFKNTKFYKNWSLFFSIFFNRPWTLVLIILSIISVWLSLKYSENRPFSTLITIMAALFAGIAGSFIKDDFSNLMMEKKGRSAVRNLESLADQIGQIRSWVKNFISKKSTTIRELEEIDRHLGTTTMNISSGLEDWIDIVPELRESKEKIEKAVEKYEDVLSAYKEELLNTKKELLKVGKDEKQKIELEKRIKGLEREVNELKKEQPCVFSGGGVGTSLVLGPYVSAGSIARFAGLNDKICSECGKSYSEDLLLTLPPVFTRDLCPECRKKYNL